MSQIAVTARVDLLVRCTADNFVAGYASRSGFCIDTIICRQLYVASVLFRVFDVGVKACWCH